MIWIGVICVFTPYIYLSQLYLGKERDPLGCSTYYLTSIPLTFIMVISVHWAAVGGTGTFIYSMFSRAACTLSYANAIETKLHSSRMRTARLLPVSPSMHCAGGVCSGGLPGPGWGVPASGPRGMYPSMQWGRPPLCTPR